jgi:bifunctional DNA-binding transcriptional regulator/antitoxin component of YhaV-PrlF toxin-antitoxin module
MHTTKVFIDHRGRTILTIPSFIRNQFDLKNKQEMEIEIDGELIKIRPIKKEENETK